MAGSEKLKADFLEKYGLEDVTFEQAAERGMKVSNKFKYVDNFLFETKRPDVKAQKYLATMMYLLNHAFEKRLPPENSNKVYDVSDINALEFIREYESIMQAEHEEKNPGTPRKKNEGIGGMVLARVEATMKGYNKSLYAVWADRIRAEAYKVEDLRRMTDDIYTRGRDRIENDDGEQLANPGAVATACILRDALEQAISQRTIGWYFWPGNWPTWAAENSYLKHLNNQVAEYRNLPGFSDDVEPIIDDYQEPMNESVNEVTEIKTKYLQQIRERKLAKANAKTTGANKVDAKKEEIQEEIKEEAAIDFDIVQEKANEILSDFRFKGEFLNEIVSEMPKGTTTDEEKLDKLSEDFNITYCISKPIREANKEFINTKGDPNTVKEAALNIFCETFDSIRNCYEDKATTLLAAQIITDKVMKKLSAAGVYPEKYGEFAKGYAINHFEEIQNKNSMASTLEESVFQEAIASYNDLEKPQQIHISELDESKDTEIVGQIKEESSVISKNSISMDGLQ